MKINTTFRKDGSVLIEEVVKLPTHSPAVIELTREQALTLAKSIVVKLM